MKSHAVELSMVFSKSFARRRFRPSQAKVRSTTRRRGGRTKPLAGVGSLDDPDHPVARLAIVGRSHLRQNRKHLKSPDFIPVSLLETQAIGYFLQFQFWRL